MFALRSARLVWGRHPLGQPIAGWNVRAFRRADVARHWRRWFVPQNLLLGIAGRFHPGDALRALRRRFSLPARAAAPLPSPLPAPLGRGLRFRGIHRPVEKTRIHLAFAAPLVRREDLLITWVLSRVLGQRLMERVRDRDGLTYAIGCEPATLSDVLGLSIATSVAPRNTERVLTAILEEVARAAREPVPAAELRRAQASLVWSYDFLKDDLEQFADFYEFQALFHPGELPRSPAAAQGVLRRLAPDRLLENARGLLRSRYLTVVVMGDLPRPRWAAARAVVRAGAPEPGGPGPAPRS
jgi:zinc protease